MQDDESVGLDRFQRPVERVLLSRRVLERELLDLIARSLEPDRRLASARNGANREDLLDEALKESFPASDPPSIADPGCAEEPRVAVLSRED